MGNARFFASLEYIEHTAQLAYYKKVTSTISFAANSAGKWQKKSEIQPLQQSSLCHDCPDAMIVN